MIRCARCGNTAEPYPHENSRVCAECFRENVVESLRPNEKERGLWWLSFVDAERGNLGVCILYADSMGQTTHRARQLGCNPGGEVLMQMLWPWNAKTPPIENLEYFHALVTAPRERLLSKDDLRRYGLAD